ncbi:MAG: signal peptidase I [archaeon]
MKRSDLEKFSKELKRYLNKLWFIVWKDDSLKGWLISILFLFIVIKFMFFPTLNFVTGTTLPLAIVESCSMYHDGNLLSNFDAWWNKHESKYSEFQITQLNFKNFIFKKGFNKGDILFVIEVKPEKVKIGDVIIFNANKDIIHRVVKIDQQNGQYTFSTMGDNVGIIQSFEQTIQEEQLVGKAVLKIAPSIGWSKLIMVDLLNKILGRGDLEYINAGFCDEN